MGFFASLYNSLWNVAWLKTVSKNTRAAWSYYFRFIALTAVVMVIIFAGHFFWTYRTIKQDLIAQPDFTAALTDGHMQVTGLAMPLVRRFIGAVFVVDTSTSTPAVEQYVQDEELAVAIGANTFTVQTPSDKKTEAWNASSTYAFTKNDILQKADQILTPKLLTVSALITVVIMFIGLVIGQLWNILWASLIVGLVVWIAKKGWHLGDLMVLGLYALTLPTIIGLVFLITGWQIPAVQFLAQVAFMLAVVFTTDKAGKQSVV